jgi:hypothetical protein
MTFVPKMFMRVGLICSLLMICLASSAFPDSTYTYQGPNFTVFSGIDSCISGVGECAITVSITLSQPLGANFSGAVTPIAFTVSDGTNVITSAQNPSVFEIFFVTGSSGVITNWNVDVGTNSGSVELFTDTFGSQAEPGLCSEASDESGNSATGCASTPIGIVGSWSVPTTATPEPSTVIFLGASLLSLGPLIRRRFARA